MIVYYREMAEPTIPHRLFTLEQEGGNDDDQDLEDEDDDREELADDEKDRDTTAPTTPEPPTEVKQIVALLNIGCISNHPHQASCSCSPMRRNCAVHLKERVMKN